MKYKDILRFSFQNIRRNKIKSFLTILSISIGVCSVFVIISTASTGKHYINKEIDSMGISGLSLYAKENGKVTLLYSDRLKKEFSFIKETMPLVISFGSSSARGSKEDAIFLGVGDSLSDVIGINLLYGKLFSGPDIQQKRNVAVIDNKYAQQLYKRENIVGKKIQIVIGNSCEEFEIIGIVDSQTTMLENLSSDRFPLIVYVPYTTANEMNQTKDADQIAIRCYDGVDTSEAASIIENKLNRIFREKSIAVENINGYISEIKKLVDLISSFLIIIAGISMLVAGIGVMNRMLSSVVERKKEIGIWIALGAKEKDIFRILMVESLLMCFLGGTIGSAVGLIIFSGVKIGFQITESTNYFLLLYPIITSVILGFTFGVFPSKNAAKIQPAELLREL